MAARTSTLAHRIAQSLVDEENFGQQDVWELDESQNEDGKWCYQKIAPCIADTVFDAVIKRVKKIHRSSLGVLIDTAHYTHLEIGFFMGDLTQKGARGRSFMRDAAVAAIISEMLEIL